MFQLTILCWDVTLLAVWLCLGTKITSLQWTVSCSRDTKFVPQRKLQKSCWNDPTAMLNRCYTSVDSPPLIRHPVYIWTWCQLPNLITKPSVHLRGIFPNIKPDNQRGWQDFLGLEGRRQTAEDMAGSSKVREVSQKWWTLSCTDIYSVNQLLVCSFISHGDVSVPSLISAALFFFLLLNIICAAAVTQLTLLQSWMEKCCIFTRVYSATWSLSCQTL